MVEVWWLMWSLQWQASNHSGIYEHPPIQFFVSWVGGCRIWSGRFTGGGSCRRPCRSRRWCFWGCWTLRECHQPSAWSWCFARLAEWQIPCGVLFYSLVTTTQMKSPGMYVFHVASFFSAMTSPGMMIGASDLSLERYSQLRWLTNRNFVIFLEEMAGILWYLYQKPLEFCDLFVSLQPIYIILLNTMHWIWMY